MPSARLDCLILLEDATGKDRAWLLAHPEHPLKQSAASPLRKKIIQRADHIPLAYIRGKTDFYGYSFYVSQDVLVPRPESEVIIDTLKALDLDSPKPSPNTARAAPIILDVGTGSGALAITAKLELPQATVYATDNDPACLKVAKRNAHTLHADDVVFFQADVLVPVAATANTGTDHPGRHSILDSTPPNLLSSLLENTPDVIIANLPYVPNDLPVNKAASYEPKQAIFGGPDGLDLYRRLFAQIQELPAPPTYLIAESLPSQHETLANLAQQAGYTLHATNGFVQLFARADRTS